MRAGGMLLGCATSALIVFGVGLALSRVHLPKSVVREIAESPPEARPEPPVADLPSDFAAMSDVAASALLYVDDHLVTRFDSARAVEDLPCDEGMPDRLLFAADGRVLGVTQQQTEYDVRVELVSVGEASAEWSGCALETIDVEQRVRTDTVHVFLRRHHGRWESAYSDVYVDSRHVPLMGPLYGAANLDWAALIARADSVRKARGKPVARMRSPSRATHFAQETDDNLRYPDGLPVSCPVRSPAPPASGFAQLEYVDPEYAPNFADNLSGAWWAIYEPNDSPGRDCVTPVKLRFVSSFPRQCGSNRPVSAAVWAPDSFPARPLLLVRSIDSLRTGQHPERFSILVVPGWNSGVLVYSDSGEVLRVIETPEGAGGYNLTAEYRGKSYGLARGSPGETWGIYWVGLLNGDTVPELILRTTTSGESETRHAFSLLISHPERADGLLWVHEDNNTVVRLCK